MAPSCDRRVRGSGFDPGLDVTLEFDDEYAEGFRGKGSTTLITIGNGDDSVSIYYPYMKSARSQTQRRG